MKHITLEIDSDLGSVSLASVAVNAICLLAGLDADQSSQVELSIVEAITNVIRHAYHGELNHKVVIAVEVGKIQVHFDIFDTGAPMPPHKVEELIHGEKFVDPEISDLSLLPEDGRGLQIIRSVMDEISYFREGKKNRLILTKRISRA